jgi:hypothetical protein
MQDEQARVLLDLPILVGTSHETRGRSWFFHADESQSPVASTVDILRKWAMDKGYKYLRIHLLHLDVFTKIRAKSPVLLTEFNVIDEA